MLLCLPLLALEALGEGSHIHDQPTVHVLDTTASWTPYYIHEKKRYLQKIVISPSRSSLKLTSLASLPHQQHQSSLSQPYEYTNHLPGQLDQYLGTHPHPLSILQNTTQSSHQCSKPHHGFFPARKATSTKHQLPSTILPSPILPSWTPLPLKWQNRLSPSLKSRTNDWVEPGQLCVSVWGDGGLCAEEGYWDTGFGKTVYSSSSSSSLDFQALDEDSICFKEAICADVCSLD